MTNLIILDLDETLIHGTKLPLERPCDFMVGEYYIYRRPYLSEFLKSCFERFDVAVWTSATPDYAEAVVSETIRPTGAPVFVWDRHWCTNRYDPEANLYYYVKDLKKVKKQEGYPLEEIIIVDDSTKAAERNYGNLVLVSGYDGREDDDELRLLALYLPSLANGENVRKVPKRNWRSLAGKSLTTP